MGSDLRLYRWQQLSGDNHGWSCQGLSKDSHSSRPAFDDLAAFLVENAEVVAVGVMLENLLRMSEVPAGRTPTCGPAEDDRTRDVLDSALLPLTGQSDISRVVAASRQLCGRPAYDLPQAFLVSS